MIDTSLGVVEVTKEFADQQELGDTIIVGKILHSSEEGYLIEYIPGEDIFIPTNSIVVRGT